MAGMFSLIDTLFGVLSNGGGFLVNAGAKKAGVDRLRWGGPKKPKAKGGLLDSPFEKKSWSETDDFLTKPKVRESKLGGHSIKNATFSGGGRNQEVVDYSKIDQKDAYKASLKDEYSVAMLSGLDDDFTRFQAKRNSEKSNKPQRLARGYTVIAQSAKGHNASHQKQADNLKNMSLRGPKRYSQEGYKGASNSNSRAGVRWNSGSQGSASSTSLRSRIKY